MTRIVVMDEELHESITVVDIPASFIREVESGERPPWIMMLPPPEPVSVMTRIEDVAQFMPLRQVRLRLERVMRGRDPKPLFWYAYADDPALALELRCAFLPGQLGEVRRREREAYWRGAFAGIAAAKR